VTTSSKNTSADTEQALPNVKFQVFIQTIRKLLRRGALHNLKKILDKTHPVDIALILRSLDAEEQWTLFQQIEDKERAAELLSELDSDEAIFFIDRLPDEKLLDLLSALPQDDLADILEALPEEKAEDLLAKMKKDRSSEVEKLMIYGEDTAGGIMNPDVFALSEDLNVKQAISAVQDAADKEMVFYIYVIDESGHLVGVISLRQLLTSTPSTLIRDIMNTSVISTRTDTDQEDAARLVSRYNILAIPVVEETNKLVGIITVDDVIDVIREEATEDMLKMVGAGDEIQANPRTMESARQRVPWLLASCLGGLVAVSIIGAFEDTLNAVIALAGFIPVIIGMGGNVGTQSSTIVVRGLAMKRINKENMWKIFFHEVRVSLVMGLFYGLLITAVTIFLFSDTPMLGPVVGLSLFSAMLISASIGSLLPLIFERFAIDPAVATGPFVTTATDILGVVVYFYIATFLLQI
jgi:magnesium transporter